MDRLIMDGVLVIDKPAGPTSHDVVADIRKAFREKKVGHTGTLDPAATGVLPLVLGRATKLARFITGADKTYHASVRLGITTDTLDSEGQVTGEQSVTATEAEVREALSRFIGDIEQVPPMYSAKKIDGKKLYELARQGVHVEREAKSVKVHALDFLGYDGTTITLRVRCSAGTYVRVLAQDIGDVLGCGGHLSELRREVTGPFTLDDAITLDQAREDPEAAKAKILPVARALSALPRIDIPGDIGRMIATGYQLTVADLRTLDTPDFSVGEVIALGLDGGTDILAVACAEVNSGELGRHRRDDRALKTERVLAAR